MPATVYHALSMTTPDDPAYENQPKHWNSAHLLTINAVGSEISNAFGNGGGITFGYDGTNVTAAAPAGAPSPVGVSAGTTSGNLGTIIFGNGNGVSFGLNGSTVTGSVATTYRASNDAIGLNSALTANGVSVTANSSGLSLNFPAFLTTAMQSNAATISNIKVSAGTTSQNLSALTFDNAGGVSFGLNGSVITGSYSQSTHPHMAISAGTNSQNTGTVSFSNANSFTFGLDGAGNITASFSQSTHSHATPAFSGSNGSFTAATVSFGNLNGMSFYTSNGSIVASYTDAGGAGAGFSGGMSNLGNTAGTSGTVASQLVFAGTNGILLSQSVNGNSATLTIDGQMPMLSYFMWPQGRVQGTSSTTMGNSSMHVQPFILPEDVSVSYIRRMVSIPAPGSSTQATTGNATITNDWYATYHAIIYTQGVGANSQSLQSVATATAGQTHRWMYTINAGSESVVWQMTYPAFGNNTNNTGLSYSQTSANINWSTTGAQSLFTSARWLDIPFASSLSGGNYWIAFQQSTSSATTGGNMANSTGLTTGMTHYNMTQLALNVAGMGGTVGSTLGLQLGLGVYTTNSSGGTIGSIPLNQISTIANQPIFPFQFIRQA